MNTDIHIELLLPATSQQVMQMLTEQKQIEIWSGEPAVFEAKEGGKVSLFDGWMDGTVQKITAKELSYTWKALNWPEGTPGSLVHFELKAEEGQTKVIMDHTGLPDEEEVAKHKTGWNDFFFIPLEDYLMVRFNAE